MASEAEELSRLAGEMRASARRLGKHSPIGQGLSGWATRLSLAAGALERSSGRTPPLAVVGDGPEELGEFTLRRAEEPVVLEQQGERSLDPL